MDVKLLCLLALFSVASATDPSPTNLPADLQDEVNKHSSQANHSKTLANMDPASQTFPIPDPKFGYWTPKGLRIKFIWESFHRMNASFDRTSADALTQANFTINRFCQTLVNNATYNDLKVTEQLCKNGVFNRSVNVVYLLHNALYTEGYDPNGSKPTTVPPTTVQPATTVPPATTPEPTTPAPREYVHRFPPMGFLDPEINSAQKFDEMRDDSRVRQTKCSACFEGPSVKSLPGNGSSEFKAHEHVTSERFLFCFPDAGHDASLAQKTAQRCPSNTESVYAMYYKKPRFSTISKLALQAYPDLDTLYLTNGDLTSVTVGAFEHLKHLGFLDLSNNKMTSFDLAVLKNQYHLTYINLTGNAIDCSTMCPDTEKSAVTFNVNIYIDGDCRNYTNSSRTFYNTVNIKDVVESCYPQIKQAKANSEKESSTKFSTMTLIGFGLGGFALVVAVVAVVVVKRNKYLANKRRYTDAEQIRGGDESGNYSNIY